MHWALVVGALGVLSGAVWWSEWSLETTGWYQLSASVRLVLLLSLPALTLGVLTVNWPAFRRRSTVHIKRIGPAEFEAQKNQYTQQCLAALRQSPEYNKFQKALEAKRVRSAFEDSV